MRSLLCLSAMLPVLALAPACDSDEGSASETTGPTTTTAGSEESGSAVGSGSTSAPTTATATTGTTPGTSTTNSTVADTGETTADNTATGDTGTETSDTSTGEPGDPPPPTDAATLLPWLEAGNYTRWDAEAERHPSLGPHFDGVRTFVNAALLESLEAGGDDHPVGSSIVKELFGPGPEVGGWAVMVKVAPGSSVGNWYWYESFEGTTYADDTGVNGCGNCHGMGVDFIRTTLPL